MMRIGTSPKGYDPSHKVAAAVPGPGAYERHDESLGRQALSNRPTSAGVRIGTSQRDGGSPSRRGDVGAPGPGAYGTADGFGKQALSGRPTSAGVRIGTSRRGDGSRRGDRGAPGPQYRVPDRVGEFSRQDSRRRNAPSFSFGSSARSGRGSAVRRRGSGTRHPQASPIKSRGGPSSSLSFVGSIGRQPSSKAATAPSFSFGTSRR